MRSRYTAYTKANIDYIEKTMQAPANKAFDAKEARDWAKAVTWQTLEVVHTDTTAENGKVEFIATYTHANKKFVLHEISQFRREAGQWFYVDGHTPENNPVTRDVPKLSRNDPCLCGSQKKYKKCCGS